MNGKEEQTILTSRSISEEGHKPKLRLLITMVFNVFRSSQIARFSWVLKGLTISQGHLRRKQASIMELQTFKTVEFPNS